jgi:HlyD family secretion protein
MIGKYLLPAVAIIGVAVAISTVIQGNQTRPLVEPAVQSAKVPFSSYVAGAGMIEASTENIAIGTPVSGIVAAIYVTRGDRVNAGEPLFKIDDRDLQGQLPVAVAKVKESEATLAKTRNLVKIAEGLRIGSSISAVDMANRRFEVAIKEAVLQSAAAQVEQIRIEIERRTIRARYQAASYRSRRGRASLRRAASSARRLCCLATTQGCTCALILMRTTRGGSSPVRRRSRSCGATQT